MATNIWDQFDATVDTKALADDVKNSSDSPNYEEVPVGNYEVAIDKLELIASKAGKPMGTVWFKVLTGDYQNQRLFYNQVLEKPFQIHSFNEFLRSLGTGMEVEFSTYRQYGNLLMDIHEKISEDHLEYAISYQKNGKGYPVYKVEEVFEPDN